MWKEYPEWVATLAKYILAILLAGVGVMAKIADEVKSGKRDVFFSKRLWLDIPAIVMAGVVTVGLVHFYELNSNATALIGPLVGFAGTRAVDIYLSTKGTR